MEEQSKDIDLCTNIDEQMIKGFSYKTVLNNNSLSGVEKLYNDSGISKVPVAMMVENTRVSREYGL